MKYLKERKEVLDISRQILAENLVLSTWGNVSRRIKGEPLLLITPSGMDYLTMTMEDVVLLDLDARLIEGERKPSTETQLHTEIYKHRPDVGAIVHVHSTFASAFAVAAKSIPVILEETAQIIGHPIQATTYAPCGSAELASQAVQSLGDGRAVLLANHGLVGVGQDLSTALKVCRIAEKTAMVCLYANSLGQVNELGAEDISVLRAHFSHYGQAKS